MGNCASSPENVIIPNEISEKYSQRLLDTNDEIGLLFERTRCGDKNSFEDILQYSREKNFLAQVFLIPIYYYTKGAIKSNAKLAVEIADKHIVKLKEMVPNTKNKYKYLNFILGYCYDMGLGVPKDNSKAIRLYSLAAAQGYAPAQKFLGSCYYVGDGVEKDLGEAVFWYRLAAEQQYADAQYALGNIRLR